MDSRTFEQFAAALGERVQVLESRCDKLQEQLDAMAETLDAMTTAPVEEHPLIPTAPAYEAMSRPYKAGPCKAELNAEFKRRFRVNESTGHCYEFVRPGRRMYFLNWRRMSPEQDGNPSPIWNLDRDHVGYLPRHYYYTQVIHFLKTRQ